MLDECEWCGGDGCDECQTAMVDTPVQAPIQEQTTTPEVPNIECEWCGGDGCDECADARAAATATANAVVQTESSQPLPVINVECEWCDNQGCDECADERAAATAAASPNSGINALTQTESTQSPPVINVECEWCDNQGCDECADERAAAVEIAQQQQQHGSIPTNASKVSTTMNNEPKQQQSSSWGISFAKNDDDDDDDYYNGGGYSQEEEELDIPSQILNLWYTAQYAQSAELQLPTLEKIENFAIDDQFPFNRCTTEQLTAFITGLTRLLGCRLTIQQPLEKLSKSFGIVINAHKRCNDKYSDLLISEVSSLLQKCEKYDRESGNANWIDGFINILTLYKDQMPSLYVPVMEKKLHFLLRDFEQLAGKFGGGSTQIQQMEDNYYVLLSQCDTLIGLCCGANNNNNNNNNIVETSPTTMMMSDDIDNNNSSNNNIGDINQNRPKFGFLSNISTTFLPKSPETTTTTTTSATTMEQTSLPTIIPGTAYNNILLEVLSLKGHIYRELDFPEKVEEMLYSLSPLVKCAKVISLILSARITDLLGYYNANNGLWKQAYIMFFTAFHRYDDCQAKSRATLALCNATLTTILSSIHNANDIGVNPLLTQTAHSYMGLNHMGLSACSSLFSGLSRLDYQMFQDGLVQWNDFSKMFNNRAGVRFGVLLRGVLLQVVLSEYSLTHDTVYIYGFLQRHGLLDNVKVDEQEYFNNLFASHLSGIIDNNNNNNYNNNNNNNNTANNNIEHYTSKLYNNFIDEMQPNILNTISNLILNATLSASINTIDNIVHFIQKQPLVALSTQNQKEVEQREQLQLQCLSSSLLNNAIPIIATLPIQNIPIMPLFLYHTHGGSNTLSTYGNYAQRAILWKSASLIDQNTLKFVFRYNPNDLYALYNNYHTTNVTYINTASATMSHSTGKQKFNTTLTKIAQDLFINKLVPSSMSTKYNLKEFHVNNSYYGSQLLQKVFKENRVYSPKIVSSRITLSLMRLFVENNFSNKQKIHHHQQQQNNQSQKPIKNEHDINLNSIFSPIMLATTGDSLHTLLHVHQNIIRHQQYMLLYQNMTAMLNTLHTVSLSASDSHPSYYQRTDLISIEKRISQEFNKLSQDYSTSYPQLALNNNNNNNNANSK